MRSTSTCIHGEDLRAYAAHLQVVAGNRPLLLAEGGADSLREGEEAQAGLTATQLRIAFEEGACGAVVFSWTDEWWRGGHAVDDWRFGLTDERRRPKPALADAALEFAAAGFSRGHRCRWPKVSVLICARNAAETIDECLRSVAGLDYPDYEVIVVNDGSTDETGAIARRHAGVTVIDTPHGGLSAARNAALVRAAGDVVAYTDADVRVDPAWLTYLVQPFLRSNVAGAGGPNVVPEDDPWMAQCVAALARLADARAPRRPGGGSTCPAATWPSAGRRCSPSAGSIRPTTRRATTSTCAGGCRRAAGGSGLRRRRSSGIATVARSGATGASRSATARPRPS